MHRLLIALLLITTYLFALDPAQKNNDVMVDPGKIVVKYKKIDNFGSVNKSAKIQLSGKYSLMQEKQIFEKAQNLELKSRLNLENVFVYQVSQAVNVIQLAEQISKEPDVEYAEPVYITKATAEPNDPLYSSQQHLPQIDAPQAWDDQYGSSSVVIGVIDSGVDWDHEDLAGIIWSNEDEIPGNDIDDDNNGYVDDIRGWDFVDNREGSGATDAVPQEDGDVPDNDPMDFGGHGSHVAGISAAETNNSTGIASVSSGALVMPIRIGWQANDGNGYGSSDFMAQGFIYAADNGADITNLSYGNSGQVLIDAAFYAFLNNVLVIESAGNNNNQIPSALGSQDWTISVASLDSDDGKSSYSNYGEYVDISAPGSNILSTVVEPSSFYNGKYVRFSGTSMAAPLVASVAGLVKAKYPSLNVIELADQVLLTAKNIDAMNPSYVGLLGSGEVNAANALTLTDTPNYRYRKKYHQVNDASGNNNGVLDPGEQANLEIAIENRWNEADNVEVELSAASDWPLSISNPTQNISHWNSILDTLNSTQILSFPISVAEDSFPQSVEMELTITIGTFTQTISFNLGISPQILFVADFEDANNGEYDFSSLYKEDFQSQNIAYDYVHRLNTEITYEMLSDYNIVIWGCEWNFPSLTAGDRAALEQYLDNGGSLFISGQDIGWELNESTDNTDPAFFQNYLKATYLGDDANESEIYGVEGDPISDGIETPFYQIRRSSANQYPDALEEYGGSVPLFTYSNGTAGAVRYDGDYKLVYFGFGGYESLTEDNTRREILKRIFNWFSGISYDLEQILDTEETNTDLDVTLIVDSPANLSSVKLFYDTDGQVPYESVNMTNIGGNIYQATIPGQPEGTDVNYFAYIVSDNGYNVITDTKSFYIGADTTPPVITEQNILTRNSVNVYGIAPFQLTVELTDNFGIDTTTAFLNYFVNNETPASVALNHESGNLYSGTFSFDDALNWGDQVSYYFSVSDRSSLINTTVSDTISYTVDTTQVIDDFELDSFYWSGDNNWGLSTNSKEGNYALSDSPVGSYQNNTNTSIAYDVPLNLSVYKAGEITYFLKALLDNSGDSLFLELSSDGGSTWTPVQSVGNNSIFYSQQIVDIDSYTGVGFDDVRLRFRLATDSETTSDGVYIDDIVINVTPDATLDVNNSDVIPKTFELSQNYPNPFNPSTTIKFGLPVSADVNISVYNILGQVVEVLADERMNAGSYSVSFDSKNTLSSGIYFYRINAQGVDGKNFVNTKKMILIK